MTRPNSSRRTNSAFASQRSYPQPRANVALRPTNTNLPTKSSSVPPPSCNFVSRNPIKPTNRRKRPAKSQRVRRDDFWSRKEFMPVVLNGERIGPLKTYQEINATEELVDAYVVEIPVYLANRAVSIFKPVIATEEAPRSFNHLRRLVNFVHLPQEFCDRHGLRIQQEGTLFFLLPKCDSLTRDSILQTVDPHLEPSSRGTKPPIRVFETEVPGYPPKTGENAREWSIHLWPCMFNPASQIMQHAPPINLLRDTLQALDTDKTISYLNLANLVAKETKEANLGRHVGVVVVDPIKNEVVAVAGDARWWTAEDSFQQRSDSDPGEGRPEQHAMMRAIAMVAAKECRRRIKDGLRPATSNGDIEELEGKALTEVERRYLSAPEDDGQGLPSIAYEPKSQSEHRKDSYLCNGLDVYLSHEPCVCCSMAMIHSRFRACVFQKRMPGTGGLTAEAENGGLGYGLFWRKELNWRVMAFQTIEITNEGQQNPSTDHIFHV